MIKWGTISMVLVVVLVSSCNSTKNGEKWGKFRQGRLNR